ncbi:MAG TPA: glycosyltransferase family 1 protein [Candidatus Caccoplasma intestinavium]|uniref:Glycosyltransferase family 1 protein n=1 Tax=Candidatus Caccoplasma intestinavium TaxID=2840716 RepID=A0A9D1GGU7_9BACT|nr:glycosyltransferase family 1 protein [Candidatus Caccoplasma intestinavium]
MKILLLGEASNLHWTLAEGLRTLGHDVTVASGGSGWMNNRRNIDLQRNSYGLIGSLRYVFDVARYLPLFRNFDVVQLSNPVFLQLRPEKNRLVFDYLFRHNRKIFLDALGTDYFYVKACQEKRFRYSDFYIGNRLREYPDSRETIEAWNSKPLKNLNRYIADRCNGIAACLYEYFISYENDYREKLAYIPIPIQPPGETAPDTRWKNEEKIQFFIGIQRDRSRLKGTDIFDKVLQEIEWKYPRECEIKRVVSLPLEEYLSVMRSSHVLIDQLYSYTPATNALQAMSQKLSVVSGAEPEYYDFIGEKQLRPIFNALPDEQQIYDLFEKIIKEKNSLQQRCNDSRAFIEKHHDYIKVAGEYLDFWEKH